MIGEIRRDLTRLERMVLRASFLSNFLSTCIFLKSSSRFTKYDKKARLIVRYGNWCIFERHDLSSSGSSPCKERRVYKEREAFFLSFDTGVWLMGLTDLSTRSSPEQRPRPQSFTRLQSDRGRLRAAPNGPRLLFPSLLCACWFILHELRWCSVRARKCQRKRQELERKPKSKRNDSEE